MNKKQQDYEVAITKYNTNPWYTRIEFFSSIIIVALQCITAANLFFYHVPIHLLAFAMMLIITYFLTDFINGIVHMVVDNSAHYTSVIGPFVAAFNLHHTRLTYKSKHVIKIYFEESGHKLWLVFYLIILFTMQCSISINFYINVGLVALGIFSSFAELSHFWCHHASQSHPLIRVLQQYRLLLCVHHHKIHHRDDNVNYAFLNGWSDPILNVIARYCCAGYKNRSDQYVMRYEHHV